MRYLCRHSVRPARRFALSLGVIVLVGIGGPATAQASCSNAQRPTSTLSKNEVGTAVTCLLNKERGKNLERNSDLDKAAQKHSEVMASKSCLAHQCPGEASTKARVQRTGYSKSPAYGEVIGALYELDSPKDLVRAWFDSPAHRDIIERSSYDHVGVGISIGGRFAYYTAVLAHR